MTDHHMSKAESLAAHLTALANDGNPFAARLLARFRKAEDPEAEAEAIVHDLAALVRRITQVGQAIGTAMIETLTGLARIARAVHACQWIAEHPREALAVIVDTGYLHHKHLRPASRHEDPEGTKWLLRDEPDQQTTECWLLAELPPLVGEPEMDP